MLHGLGSNFSAENVKRASKSLGVIEAACTNFLLDPFPVLVHPELLGIP